jgi:RNA-binding protein
MALTSSQRKFLKACAHSLNPIIQVGKQGFDERVQKSLSIALDDHELLKVQLLFGGEGDKKADALHIAQTVKAELVQLIGFKAVLYRANPRKENGIVLPRD